MEDSLSIPQHIRSPTESPPGTRDHSEREETPEDMVMDKRVTRAANGISKKAPVDPNNVVKYPYFCPHLPRRILKILP